MINNKNSRRQVRHARIRRALKGSAALPRLSVWRGLRSTTAQIIDDSSHQTLVYVSSRSVKAPVSKDKTIKVALAYAVGEKLAAAALEKSITKVVFDRGGYRYHGRVQALAEGARAGGLKF
ncbi:MAG: 50S ribosomal protein L18 [Candidatus Magasanikbacteria bacterium]|nr:50S ribosomal protein L18 [Candidatus Magasanikbacteria bacterium]